ncbi:MAG: hypothetical protein JXR30_02410 [Alphaproteobacteria bacterium]|nr:hypothetical protein [Alphaproteobacteria bacterium]
MTSEIIGFIGVSFVVISYGLLQFKKIKSGSISYDLLNLIGASMILYSLFFNWNFPSFVIQVIWILISVYSLFHSKK